MSAALNHYQALAAAAPQTHAYQAIGRERLSLVELPNRKQEAWRYTPLAPVLNHQFTAASREEGLLEPEDIASLRVTPADHVCIVLLNGFFMPELSTLPPQVGLEVLDLEQAIQHSAIGIERLGSLSGACLDLFGAVNAALTGSGAYLRVTEKLTQPVEIIHLNYSFESEVLSNPRVLVQVAANARLNLIEQHAQFADLLGMSNGVTEIFLSEGAQLLHPRLQHDSVRTRHLSHLYVQQAATSVYKGTSLALGSAWSRTEFHLDFVGEHAHCELNGFYLAGEQQMQAMHLDVLHSVPNCTSRETFKGILYGHGKGVFDGNILVKKDAQKTDARLSNDNLLLSREAEIDTKPRLEIYADDVQCSHGTTVGQIDPEMLFYLRARGIPKAEATSLICQGFAAELIAHCEYPALEAKALSILQERLAPVAAKL
ncbi:Fe-S cluster assembly protein SufD [Thiothrix eikelboomii]|uniref:Fe-S cluster assembly protein SufD n=1 Tax=Thiothrix eikelboomii TaxID=92487 RepID=UPI003BAF2C2F